MIAKRGFTLIELMIVVAIIAIIAAIAIPNLLRSRLSATEASAISSVRQISTAQAQFQTSSIIVDATGVGRYGTLIELGAINPPALDASLIGGFKADYTFVVTLVGSVPGAPQYQSMATYGGNIPTARAFFGDESGIIRFTNDGSVPDVNSLPIN